MKQYMALILLLLLNGCGQYSVRNIDKPPPEDYETWEKQNHSVLQIKKAYEKIGVLGKDHQMNEAIQESMCMENAGYKKKRSSWSAQQLYEDSNFPERKSYLACEANAIVSAPSIERRLNSWYCKVKTDYDYCLKHALAPQLCSPEKISNLPPECLADGQVPSSKSHTNSSTEVKLKTVPYTPPDRMQQQILQLQRDNQNHNNRQMNSMLKNTAPKIRR